MVGLLGLGLGATAVTIYGNYGYRCGFIWLPWLRVLLYIDIVCNCLHHPTKVVKVDKMKFVLFLAAVAIGHEGHEGHHGMYDT